MNNQIERMYGALWRNLVNYETDDGVVCVDYEKTAENLIAEGYRKTTDVAREIFTNVEKVIRKYYKLPQYDLMYDLYKLKKKYESEGADDE